MVLILITFFSIPIGAIMIYFEQKKFARYEAIFHDFFDEVRASSKLTSAEKIQKIRAMLEHNHYHILRRDDHSIEAEKKLFSAGRFIFSLGLNVVGVTLYLLYFYKIQKPHRLKFSL